MERSLTGQQQSAGSERRSKWGKLPAAETISLASQRAGKIEQKTEKKMTPFIIINTSMN